MLRNFHPFTSLPSIPLILLILLMAPWLVGQTTPILSPGNQTAVDMSGAQSTKTIKSGTTIPSTCTVGELFFKSDAPAGANISMCTATDTWSQLGIANYSQGFAAQTSVALAHNKSTTAIVVACYDNSVQPLQIGYNSLQITNSNTATVTFASPQTGTCVVNTSGGGTGISGSGGLADPGANGFVARTALDTTAPRTFQGTTNRLTITNPTGLAGDPVFDLGSQAVTTAQNATFGAFTYDFSGATAIRIKTGAGAPSSTLCDQDAELGSLYLQNDTNSLFSPLYACARTSTTPTRGWILLTAVVSGTTAPLTCTVGQLFFKTDATAGQNLFGCTATDTWTQLGGSSGSGDVTQSGTNTFTGTNIFTSSIRRIPNGTSLPGTCTVGDEFMNTAATLGQQHFLCTSTNTWTLQGDGGGGATNISGLDNCKITISGSVATIHSPCTINIGNKPYVIVGDATGTLSGTSSSGEMRIYTMKSGANVGAIIFDENTAATNTVSGNAIAGTAGVFPANSKPIAQATFVANSFTASQDYRTFIGYDGILAGTGLSATVNADGSTSLSIDSDVATLPVMQSGSPSYCRSTSGNDTYVCSLAPVLTTYTRGMCLTLDADTANTGTATVNVNSLGAKSILSQSAGALSDGDIGANKPKLVCYDGTQFLVQGDGGSGGGGGITSLGGQTGSTQTFANDTNVTINSATDTHTLGWTGTLAISRGGTGAGTASAALDALLPTQSGHSGEFLTTNGTTHSWAAGGGGSGDVTDIGDCSTGACFSSGGAGTSLIFRNATSGTVTLTPVAGALGTVTLSLPAVTSTLATLTSNSFTGVQNFSNATQISVKTGNGAPGSTLCDQDAEIGAVYVQNDADSIYGTVWFCERTTSTPTRAWVRQAITPLVTSDPGTCAVGDSIFRTDTGTLKYCTAPNTFTAIGSGAVTFSAITGSTNTTAAMVVGTGASIDVTGSGTINATSLGGTAAASYATDAEVAAGYQPLDAALTALAGGSDFVVFSGPASTSKTFTLPNANATILTTNASVTVAQGGTGIASGTSGGVPYFSGSTTIASSAALTANLPVIGGGAGAAPSVGTRSGNTTAFVTTTGTQTSGRCVEIDANGNHVAAAGACSGSVAGSDTQVIFNNSGAYAGDAGMTYNSGTDTLSVGAISTGGGGVAGMIGLTAGTTNTPGTSEIVIEAPTSVTAYKVILPGTSATGLFLGTNSSNVNTVSFVGSTTVGQVLRVGSGPTIAFGAVDLADTDSVTGVLPDANIASTIARDSEVAAAYQPLDAALTAIAGGSDFVQFSGPASTTKTFTLPNANATLLYDGGALGTPSSGTLTNATGLPTAGLVNNAVTSAKMAVVNTRRVCDMVFGDTTGSALTNGQLGPQKRLCFIPAASTVQEITVAADDGTPNIIVARNVAGTVANLTSAALATAASGGIACSKTTAVTGIDGATTCSATLQNTALAAGSYIEAVSGTAGGTAKLMTVHVVYTVD